MDESDFGKSVVVRKEGQYVTKLRQQLHRLPGSEVFTGRLLGVNGRTLFGWVCNETRLEESVTIECLRDGRKFAEALANVDLDSAMPLPKDLRRHAFRIEVPKSLISSGLLRKPSEVTLRIAGTSVILALAKLGHRSLASAGYDGHCEVVRPGVLNGWVWKPDEPDANVDVALFINGHFPRSYAVPTRT